MVSEHWLSAFITREGLAAHYGSVAQQWFLPVAAELAERAAEQQDVLVVGIQGCQGSGKSTLAALLEHALETQWHIATQRLSLDDFYLSRSARAVLAEREHPLFIRRGPPGTHDMGYLSQVLDEIFAGADEIVLPRFDKLQDDRAEEVRLLRRAKPVRVVIIEGWCLGLTAQRDAALAMPVNHWEQEYDADGCWRRLVNTYLGSEAYQSVFNRVDDLLILQAPGFAPVVEWRWQQECYLKARNEIESPMTEVMDRAAVEAFVQPFQRLTEHALQVLPSRARCGWQLDSRREVVSAWGLGRDNRFLS